MSFTVCTIMVWSRSTQKSAAVQECPPLQDQSRLGIIQLKSLVTIEPCILDVIDRAVKLAEVEHHAEIKKARHQRYYQAQIVSIFQPNIKPLPIPEKAPSKVVIASSLRLLIAAVPREQ